jgi:beta-lactamase class A
MLKPYLGLAMLLWLSAVTVEEAPAQTRPPTPTPALATRGEWRPLAENADTALQASLVRALNANAEWRRLIQRRQLAIGVVDLSSPRPRFARVNGDKMMYAASLPKIAILLAAYASFEDGSLAETPALHDDLKAMIQVSSNEAATRTIDAVGMGKIAQVMRDPHFGFYDEAHGGGLWVGKRYATSGVRQGDPLYNISHGATATQVCRFYYLLAQRRLINAERSEQMLADLADPHLHHKFVAELDKLAPDAKVYRKSGTWRTWHADSVLVQGTDWRNYILVALVESPNGEKILRDLVPTVETVLHGSPSTERPRALRTALIATPQPD